MNRKLRIFEPQFTHVLTKRTVVKSINMAAITPGAHLLTVYLTNSNEIVAFKTTELLDTLEVYAELTGSDIKAIASKFKKRTVANGRILLPQKPIKNI